LVERIAKQLGVSITDACEVAVLKRMMRKPCPGRGHATSLACVVAT